LGFQFRATNSGGATSEIDANHHLAIVFSKKWWHIDEDDQNFAEKISGKSFLHHESRTRGKKARTQQDNLGQMTFVKMVEGTS